MRAMASTQTHGAHGSKSSIIDASPSHCATQSITVPCFTLIIKSATMLLPIPARRADPILIMSNSQRPRSCLLAKRPMAALPSRWPLRVVVGDRGSMVFLSAACRGLLLPRSAHSPTHHGCASRAAALRTAPDVRLKVVTPICQPSRVRATRKSIQCGIA